ncbi:MAG: hypothetical protein J5I93_21585 [Pirellulaceae bacterium]|nr:hypothetical protein [Pirellulaceae bacterium]
MHHSIITYARPALVFSAALILFSQPLLAARLLNVTFLQDGRVVARTYYSDNGRADAATVWRYLERPPIMADTDVAAIPSSPDDPLRATLSGDVRIRFQHTDRVLAEAQVHSLTLRRDDATSQNWYLSPAEVERTAAAAGLGAPAATPSGIAWSVTALVWGLPLAVLLAILLAGLGLAIMLGARRATSPSRVQSEMRDA